jgi:hypothetical protein
MITLANGAQYALPCPCARPILSNHPQVLTGAMEAGVPGQGPIETGGYGGLADNAENLKALAKVWRPSGPLVLNYEGEGRDLAGHQRLGNLIRIARAGAPMRQIGMYGYPYDDYGRVRNFARSILAVTGPYTGPATEQSFWAGRWSYHLSQMNAARATSEIDLAAVADFAAPSCYVPAAAYADWSLQATTQQMCDEAERWAKPVIAFVSACYAGKPNGENGLIPPAARLQVLRGVKAAGATPLIYVSDTAPAHVTAAQQAMVNEWHAMNCGNTVIENAI